MSQKENSSETTKHLEGASTQRNAGIANSIAKYKEKLLPVFHEKIGTLVRHGKKITVTLEEKVSNFEEKLAKHIMPRMTYAQDETILRELSPIFKQLKEKGNLPADLVRSATQGIEKLKDTYVRQEAKKRFVELMEKKSR